MPGQFVYHSPLYRNFRDIEPNDYQRIVRFYEGREQAIGQLDFGEYFDLTVAYTDALFEVGAYRKHLLVVDGVIEAAIEYSVMPQGNDDVYSRMLFRKAASSYRLQRDEQAVHVLRELLRMRPDDSEVSRFLRQVIQRRFESVVQRFRATAIFLLLLSALVIVIEVLLVRNFYDMYTPLVEASRNTILALGLLSMGAGPAWAYWLAHRQVEHWRAHDRTPPES